MTPADRFLTLVRRELGAADARLELGGSPPRAPQFLWVPLPSEGGDAWRLVVRFAAPPRERAAMKERLAALAESFADTLADTRAGVPIPPVAVSTPLREAIDSLCDRAEAHAVLVVDDRSPWVWCATESAAWLHDAEDAQALGDLVAATAADLDWVALLDEAAPAVADAALRARVAEAVPVIRTAIASQPDPAAALAILAAVAVARASRDNLHEQRATFGCLSRPFGGVYRLVLVFDAPFSALKAEGVARRALPIIERLVLELPPVDPPPKGGRVVPLF